MNSPDKRRCLLLDWGDTLMRDEPDSDGPMYTWAQVEAMPYAFEVLTALKPEWVIALATNAAASDEADIRAALRRVGLDELVERVYCFRRIGHKKPSREFFDFIVNDLQLDRMQVFMIGDAFENDVIGANQSGIRGIWFNPRLAESKSGAMYRTIHHLSELPKTLSAFGSRYELVPLQKRDAAGALYTIGHAMIWDPGKFRMESIISHDTLRRDTMSVANAPHYVKMGLAERIEPYPAINVRQAIEKHPGGIAYFNAGETGMLVNPLIEDGKLLTKPPGARAVWQKTWEPLNDTFAFFLQHADGRVEIRAVRIQQNQIHPDDLKYVYPGTFGFSVPYILKAGKQIKLKNPPPERTSKGDETMFLVSALAAMDGIGLTADGRVVFVGLIGDLENPADQSRLPTEDDLVRYLLDFDVTDALFAGGSGDVQYYDAPSKTLAVAAERAKDADKRWVLQEGQTERGLSLIVKLVER